MTLLNNLPNCPNQTLALKHLSGMTRNKHFYLIIMLKKWVLAKIEDISSHFLAWGHCLPATVLLSCFTKVLQRKTKRSCYIIYFCVEHWSPSLYCVLEQNGQGQIPTCL